MSDLSINSVGAVNQPGLLQNAQDANITPYYAANDGMEYDSFEYENENKTSTGKKVAIGLLGATALAVGLDFLFAKGKHVKKLFSKAKEEGEEAVEKAKDDVKEAVEETAGEVKEGAEKLTDDLVKKAEELAEKLKTGTEKAEGLETNLGEKITKGEDTAKRLEDATKKAEEINETLGGEKPKKKHWWQFWKRNK